MLLRIWGDELIDKNAGGSEFKSQQLHKTQSMVVHACNPSIKVNDSCVPRAF